MKIIKMFFVLVLLILACLIGNSMLNNSMISHDVSMNDTDIVANENAININTASADELCEIKHIGKTIAGYIVDYRERFGEFNNIEQIKNIDGISDKLFEEIKPYINLGGK